MGKRRGDGRGVQGPTVSRQVGREAWRVPFRGIPDFPPKPGGHLGHPPRIASGLLVWRGSHGAKTVLFGGKASLGCFDKIVIRVGRLVTWGEGSGGGPIFSEKIVNAEFQFFGVRSAFGRDELLE